MLQFAWRCRFLRLSSLQSSAHKATSQVACQAYLDSSFSAGPSRFQTWLSPFRRSDCGNVLKKKCQKSAHLNHVKHSFYFRCSVAMFYRHTWIFKHSFYFCCSTIPNHTFFYSSWLVKSSREPVQQLVKVLGSEIVTSTRFETSKWFLIPVFDFKHVNVDL